MSATAKTHDLWYKCGAILSTLIAAILIVFSSLKQSLTVDEPNHIYCGMEYLQYGSYTAWPENPVLSRGMAAIGPYLSGYRIDKVAHDKETMRAYQRASNNLEYFSNDLIRNKLFWARIFILPMFLLSAWVVWAWSMSLGGSVAAFLAVGMYTTLPTIMAHSGLATTDITFAATFIILLWCFSRWLNKPNLRTGCWLGISLSASLLAKYSVLVFFPIAIAVSFLSFLVSAKKVHETLRRQWLLRVLKSGMLAISLSAFLVWACYGFSFGRLADEPVIAAGIKEGKVTEKLGNLYLPAPEWFAGLKILMVHNARGQRAYLLGEISRTGFKNFYPVALLVKTPLPFLLLFITGIIGTFLRSSKNVSWELWALILIPFAILIALMPSNINLGLRHILILYAIIAIGAAVGTCRLLKQLYALRYWKLMPLGLVVWQLVISVMAFPNYLSYFNLTAGREPGALLVDSDLDWGQGLFDLSKFCKEQKIDTLHLAYFGIAKDCWYSFPYIKFMPDSARVHGWVAVSETLYRGVWVGALMEKEPCKMFRYQTPFTNNKINSSYHWVDQYPLVKRAGGAIRVYYVP